MDERGATTVEDYLAQLPPDRRDAIAKVRDVVNANLPDGYEEGIQSGMIGWYVPLSRFPETYNGQPLAVAALGSQKSHMALYLMSVYGHAELDAWFRDAFAKAGKKLDMGKSCVRFKSIDALPLDVIGETIRRVPVDAYLGYYEDARASSRRATKPAATKPAATKPAATKPAAPKPAAPKKAAPKKAAPKKAAPKAKAKQPAASKKKAAAKQAKPRRAKR
jgi:uncharacterized protein YdhG (YjbR/CyaY superfamily)